MEQTNSQFWLSLLRSLIWYIWYTWLHVHDTLKIEKSESLKFEILLTSFSMSGAECKLWLMSLSTDTSKAAVRRSPLAHSSASWAGKVIFRGFSLDCIAKTQNVCGNRSQHWCFMFFCWEIRGILKRNASHRIILTFILLHFSHLLESKVECQWMSCILMLTKLYLYRQEFIQSSFGFSWDFCGICGLWKQCFVEKKRANSSSKFAIWVFAMLLCAPPRPDPVNYTKLSSMHTFQSTFEIMITWLNWVYTWQGHGLKKVGSGTHQYIIKLKSTGSSWKFWKFLATVVAKGML